MHSQSDSRHRNAVRGALLSTGVVTTLLLAPTVSHADEVRSFHDCPLLLEGDSGECVERLQRELNAVNSAYSLPETGYFGSLTRIAVLDFQGRTGLDADGNVGGETADALLAQLSVSSPRPGTPGPGTPAPPVREEESGTRVVPLLPSTHTCGVVTCTNYWSVDRTKELNDEWKAAILRFYDAGQVATGGVAAVVGATGIGLIPAAIGGTAVGVALEYKSGEFEVQVAQAAAGGRCLIYKYPRTAPNLGWWGSVSTNNKHCR